MNITGPKPKIIIKMTKLSTTSISRRQTRLQDVNGQATV